MKKLSKILCLLLICVLVLAVFVGCNKKPASGAASGTNQNGNGSNTDTGEPYEITFYYDWMIAQPSDDGTAAVEQALNKILADKGYNYTVDIQWLNLMEYSTQMDLLLAAGGKADVVFCGMAGMSSMVDNGYLVNLDPYLDNVLSDTVEVLGRFIECGKNDGSVYAIPCRKGGAMTYMYVYQPSYMDAIGFDKTQLNSFYDEEAIFAKLHAAYPDMYVDRNGDYVNIIGDILDTSVVGTFGATVGENTNVVSYFETQAWKDAIDVAWKWRNLGYLHPDGSQNGQNTTASTHIGYNVGNENDEEACAKFISSFWGGVDVDCKQYEIEDKETSFILWGVAYTSKNPKAAASFLNLLWTDYDVLNMVMWGIEGTDYVLTEPTKDLSVTGIGAFVYPEGKDRSSVPYSTYENYGIFGNEFLMIRWPDCTVASREYAYTSGQIAWTVPLFGFTPKNEKISSEIAACSNVRSQYYDALMYGDIDPDNNAEFVKALYTAGLQNVLDEYNRQAGDWLKTQDQWLKK